MKQVRWKIGIVASMIVALVLCTQLGLAQEKPAELKVGITTYLTGPASVFGVPGKAAFDIMIEEINAKGGIDGVKIAPFFIDEGVGTSGLLSEYRRANQEMGIRVMLAAISSGHCLALAPVAEDLKILNVMWDCSTERVLEDAKFNYVFRTQANATIEMVAAVIYLLKTKPDFKTVAVVNQDYAWGRDSWEIFSNTLKALKPDVKVVAELFPKFGASDFSAEISRLQALKPDVILTTSWGGDLDTFIRQASQRGLLKSSTFVMPLLESSMERVGDAIPDGVIAAGRGDHYFLHPETKSDPEHVAFVKKFREKTGAYPIYPSYHAVQSVIALKAAYEKAIKANGGKWPTIEQAAAAMKGLEFKGFGRSIKIREDGQGLEDQMYGITKKVPEYPFPVMDNMMFIPADVVATPVGLKSPEYVKKISPEILKKEFKTYKYTK
ncbi:MAG: ABC transporter substrate-binding protein [Desulfobacterales bacterium]|nr:ABC transporter substrate-binding protein [Desulfobacterales bacterium]